MSRARPYVKGQTGSTTLGLARGFREQYLDDARKRKEALLSAVGLWKDRTDLPDTEQYIRELRHGNRLRGISSDGASVD